MGAVRLSNRGSEPVTLWVSVHGRGFAGMLGNAHSAAIKSQRG
jgi:hypothetical protein